VKGLPSALVLAFAFAFALGACAVSPRHPAHVAPLDASALGLNGAPEAPISERWWQAFSDPQLDALVGEALTANPSLAEVLARLERARADARAAASAQEPQLDASAVVTRERYSARYIIPPPYGGSTFWDGQADIGLSYEVDFWGRQSALIRAAARSARARELDARAATLAVEGALVTAYVELDRRYADSALAAADEDTRRQLAALTRKRVDAGLDTGIDLRTADAALPASRADRSQATAAVELAVHRIAAVLGRGPKAYDRIARPKLSLDNAITLPSAIPGDLLLRRPDVEAALARIDAATAGEDAARLAAYPDINLRAFAGVAALTLADLVSAPARTYGVGPAVHLPIFDGGLLRARLRGASADLDAAIAQYNSTVLGAAREVADALTTVDTLGRALHDANERLEQLVGARRLADERFRGGIGTRLAVLEAESRVTAAQRVVVSTRALDAEARVALIVALGGAAPTGRSPASDEVSP
jgi:NodT family efflux transporter outer membrane factor (OMF) lipoprotein